jgi:hypothetical protein
MSNKSKLRSDNFFFVKTEDGNVVRQGQTRRNWLALVFLGLVEIGLISIVISTISRGSTKWQALAFFILFAAGIAWLMWTIIRLLRVRPLQFDSQHKAILFEEDGFQQQVPFSEIRRIDMSFQRHPDTEVKSSGTYNIVAYLTGVRSVPIAQISGAEAAAKKRAQELVALIENVTGTGSKPAADMTAKMKTIQDINLDSFNVGMIAQHLGRIQQEGGQGNFVIFVADEKANYFIQFAGQQGDTFLFAEASGNPVIPGNYRLSPEKLSKLQGLGWTPPLQSEMNYHRHWQASSYDDRLAIAQAVMRTFIEVYGVDPDQPIEAKLNLE